jgi:hypothetical protein
MKCKICGGNIHPTRLKILPNTTTCIECSSVKAKHGVPIMYGQKDDTWVDVVFMEEDEYRVYKNLRDKKINTSKPEMQNFDKEELNLKIEKDE